MTTFFSGFLFVFLLGLISFGRKFYRLNGRILRFLTSEEFSYEHTFVLKGDLLFFIRFLKKTKYLCMGRFLISRFSAFF